MVGIASVILVPARAQRAGSIDASVVVGRILPHARIVAPAQRAARVAAILRVGTVQKSVFVVGLVTAVFGAPIVFVV